MVALLGKFRSPVGRLNQEHPHTWDFIAHRWRFPASYPRPKRSWGLALTSHGSFLSWA